MGELHLDAEFPCTLLQDQQQLHSRDAAAKSIVGAIALEHVDFGPRIRLLHQDGEEQTGGPAAEACDAHPQSLPGLVAEAPGAC